MTRYADGRLCERPDEVRAIAARMRRWPTEAETCQSCSASAAMFMVSGEPLCARCRSHRAERADSAVLDRRHAWTEAEPQSTGAMLRGLAVVFNVWSTDVGGFVERVKPEAVDRSIASNADIRALWNGNSDKPIGRFSAGTLSYWKTSQGLAVQITPPSWCGPQIESIERGDVSAMSFAFRTIEDEWYMDGSTPKRDLLDLVISSVSIAVFPAFDTTHVSVVEAAQRGRGQLA